MSETKDDPPVENPAAKGASRLSPPTAADKPPVDNPPAKGGSAAASGAPVPTNVIVQPATPDPACKGMRGLLIAIIIITSLTLLIAAFFLAKTFCKCGKAAPATGDSVLDIEIGKISAQSAAIERKGELETLHKDNVEIIRKLDLCIDAIRQTAGKNAPKETPPAGTPSPGATLPGATPPQSGASNPPPPDEFRRQVSSILNSIHTNTAHTPDDFRELRGQINALPDLIGTKVAAATEDMPTEIIVKVPEINVKMPKQEPSKVWGLINTGRQ